MRVLVTGSRDWVDRSTVADALADVFMGLRSDETMVVVHGAAPGADSIAAWWAAHMSFHGHRVVPEAHPADWDKFGKAAGPVRNSEMVKLGADLCLAFPIGESRGTRGCMSLVEKVGIPTRVIEG